MNPNHKNLPRFNPLPKIIEIAKDKEVPRQIIINDLVALEAELQKRECLCVRHAIYDDKRDSELKLIRAILKNEGEPKLPRIKIANAEEGWANWVCARIGDHKELHALEKGKVQGVEYDPDTREIFLILESKSADNNI